MLITGSGRGIGAATARLAVQQGYAVCVNYTSQDDRARMLVETLCAQGGHAIAIQADVSDEHAVTRLFEMATEQLGTITVLVNNAGTTGKIARLRDQEISDLRRVLDVNVLGTLLCSREAVRRMSTALAGQGGVIINVSSRAALHGSPHEYVHYAASKGAVESLTVGLAREVASEGIRVNCISPGIIATEIHASGGDPARVERLASTIPLQRAGEVEEVARAILWLASPEASYCTGSILAVGGGR